MGRAHAAVAEGVWADHESRRDGRKHPRELGDVPGRSVLEFLEYPLADPRLGTVDAGDHVQFGNAESAITPFDVLLEAVLPDLDLPPGPQLGQSVKKPMVSAVCHAPNVFRRTS